MMEYLTPVFDKFSIPKADRIALVELFQSPPELIPSHLWHYFRDTPKVIRACEREMSRVWFEEYKRSAMNA